MIAQQFNTRFILTICAGIFLILSLTLYRAVPNSVSHLDHDSFGYDRIATYFENTLSIGDPENLENAPIQPVGYPLFLGIIYRLCGHNYSYIIFFQIILCLLSGLLLFKIARHLFGVNIALIVMALSAVNLGFLIYPQFLLAEITCLFFILAFFERFLEFMHSDCKISLASAGLLLGMSVLIKPMALLYIFLLVPVILFKRTDPFRRRQGDGGLRKLRIDPSSSDHRSCPQDERGKKFSLNKENYFLNKLFKKNKNFVQEEKGNNEQVLLSVRPAASAEASCEGWKGNEPNRRMHLKGQPLLCLTFIISFYAPILSYMTYNYHRYNTFALAPMTELNMYQCFLSKVIAHVEQLPVEQVLETTLAFKGAHSFDSSGWDHAKILFYEYIKKHPFTCTYVWCKNVLKTLVGLYSTQLKVLVEPTIKGGDHSFFKTTGSLPERVISYIIGGTQSRWIKIIALFEAFWSVMRWVLVFIGFFILFKQKNYMLCWLFGSFIFQAAFVTGMDGCCRYRVMFEPLLIIVATLAIGAMYNSLKSKKRSHPAVAYPRLQAWQAMADCGPKSP